MKNKEEFEKHCLEYIQSFEQSDEFIEKNNYLKDFVTEYPLEKFIDLSLEDYVLGTNNKNSLCYKIEFGKYKYVGPSIGGGSSAKYGIYYSKDKSSFTTINGITTEPERIWKNIKEDVFKVIHSVANANSVSEIKDDYSSLKGMPSYIVKISYFYFPQKLVSIAGRKYLKEILDTFDIEYSEDYSSLKLSFLINQVIRSEFKELSNINPVTLGNLLWSFCCANNYETDKNKQSVGQKTWVYSPGENANRWNEFYNEGIMAINYDEFELGDLRQYASKSEIKEAMGGTSSRKNDVLAIWEFTNVLKIGDIVYAKRGTDTIIGKGVVESDYIYDENRQDYKSYRKVNWLYNEEKSHADYIGHGLAQKTLTDISKFPEDVERLEKIYEKQSTDTRSVNEYTRFDFLDEVLMTEEKYDNIVNTLERKKNIILQGAPGVGKTYCAKRLMYSLMNYKDDSKIRTVQFHQSYSYEDFIQGYRPNDDGNFELKNGLFYNLVQEARREYERAITQNEEPKKYCMIIDEINRGNLSKVFGELMMLIESDKRDPKWSINLTYSDDEFYIPSNLYIIGTMNTADRSLTTIDYALRRRFAFINLEPAFENDETCDKLKDYLIKDEKVEAVFVGRIITAYKRLNNFIEHSLGKDFKIGHSYFINQFNGDDDNEEVYKSIVNYEILPLIEEYFYDDKDKVEEAKKIIENI
ncbi:MAG: AAA family ATPase [Clostridia bacterium]|nr:AAA family ATPase [Clostridia bacterium]